MTTLKAGSYLALLSNPQLDLMDIVNEEAPRLINKERSWSKTVVCKYLGYRGEDFPEDPEQYTYTAQRPYQDGLSRISYENTHGLRFGNCNHVQSYWTIEPATAPWDPAKDITVYSDSPDPGRWSHFDVIDTFVQGSNSIGGYGSVFIDNGTGVELYPGYPGPAHHLVSNDDELDIEEELTRAYDTIRPVVTSDMSLLVTLAELKDVKSLFSEPIAFARRVIHALGRRRAAKMNLVEILTDPDVIPFLARTVAEGKLYKEFGLKQVVRDVSSLYSTFFTLDRYVRDILSMTGENTRYYSLPLFERKAERFDHVFEDADFVSTHIWNSAFTRKFVVTMKYTSELVDAYGQPISPNDPELVALGRAMDTLGLNMNPAILWDLIPFSFVVDYFVGIGDWLERFKMANLSLTFGVTDSCYSVKEETITEGSTWRWTQCLYGRERYPDNPLAAREVYCGGIRFSLKDTRYQRVRFVPTLRMLSGLRAPDFRLPGKEQLKIMASLLTTNLPILGNRR